MQLSNTVVQGYQAFTGITALLGDENERLIEVFAKMQIVQQSLAAVEEVRAALDKQSILSTQARALWTNALNVSLKLFGKTQASATVGVRMFGKALVATGIGAIVVALGLLIANFDEVSKVVKKVVMWQINLYKKIPFLADAIEFLTGVVEKIIVAFGGLTFEEQRRVEAINELIEAERKRRDALEETYNEEIALAKARGEDTFKLEQERLRAIRDSIRTELKMLLEKRKITGEWSDEELERVKEQVKELKKLNLEIKVNEIRHAKELEKIEEGKQKALAEKRRKAWEKKQQEEKERREKEKEQAKAHTDDMLNLQQRYEDLLLEQQLSGYELELEKLRVKHEREIDELRKKGLTEQQLNEQLAVLKLAQQAEIEIMNAEHDKELQAKKNEKTLAEHEAELQRFSEFNLQKFELARQFAQQEFEAGIISKEEFAKKKAEIDKQELETVQKIEEAKLQIKLQTLNAAGQLINALGGIMAEGSKQQKAFALAGLVIDQAQAISSAIVAATKAAAAAPPGTQPFVYAGVAAQILAGVISTIGKAKALLKAPAPSPVTVETPRLNIGGGSGTGGGGGVGSSQQQGGGGEAVGFDNITRVIVVESDITDTQLANAEVKEASNI
jgi:DNA repair exonuclease SbcCD ATPase subunit